MNEAEILAAADRNLWQLFEALAAAVPDGDRDDDGDLVRLSSGSPIGFFNPTFPKGPVDPAAAVARTSEWYGEMGRPFVMLFREATAPGLADACTAAGLVEHWQMPLMVLDPIPMDEPSIDGLEIIEVTADQLAAYLEVVCAGFGMPPELFRELGPSMFGIESFIALLGLVDGVPVATSAAYVSGDTIGVYNVAVLESHRRQGLGEALTAAAARAGAEAGATRSILQSSQLGEPVYRRMGYETLDRYRQFEAAPAPS